MRLHMDLLLSLQAAKQRRQELQEQHDKNPLQHSLLQLPCQAAQLTCDSCAAMAR